jgi:pimeloyl-ACP methyl ester carboxylesterase
LSDRCRKCCSTAPGNCSARGPPDEAELPLDALRQADFPILVVSGGHLRANEVICDTIAERTDARRAVCPGAGHLVPDTGAPFNAILEDFLTSATRNS